MVAAAFPKKFRVTDDTNPNCSIAIGITIHSRFHIACHFTLFLPAVVRKFLDFYSIYYATRQFQDTGS